MAWVFSVIWFFAMAPLWDFSLRTAELNNFHNLPGAGPLYTFFASVYPWAPFLAIVLFAIGLLKYASTVRRGIG